jgi:hypothetical protein
MPVTIDKPDAFRRMARVKGWCRNGDILELCDILEHVLTVGYDPVTGRKPDPVTAPAVAGEPVTGSGARSSAGCPDCAKRRAADLARQRKKRNKAKSKAALAS